MIRIRSAKYAEIEKIADLNMEMMKFHLQFGATYILRKDARRRIVNWLKKSVKSRKERILVAEDNAELVGYFIITIRNRPPLYKDIKWGFISDAFVKESYRRKGVTRLFMDEAMKWFKKRGVSHVDLYVTSGNKGAVEVWKKCKFKEYHKRMVRKV